MRTHNSGQNGQVPIILVAPDRGGPVRIARYHNTAGEEVIGNADFTPHSVMDGMPLQAMGSKQETLGTREVAGLTPFGKCTSCSSNLVATAGAVDAMEIAHADVHCPMCSTSITPAIDPVKLSMNLAAEIASTFPEHASDDDDDSDDDTYDDMDDSDDEDVDDDTEEDDDDGDDEDVDDDTEEDDDDGDDEDSDDDDVNDDESFYSDDSDDEDDGDDDESDDDDVEQAAEALRPLVAATRRRAQRHRALASGDGMGGVGVMPMDEAPMDGSDMDGRADEDYDDIDADGVGDSLASAVAAVSRAVRAGEHMTPRRMRELAKEDDSEDEDDDDKKESASVRKARLRVVAAERRLRQLGGEETERTRRLNTDKVGNTRPDDEEDYSHDSELYSPNVPEVSPPADDDLRTNIRVGKPATASRQREIAAANTDLIYARIELECAREAQPIAGRPNHNRAVADMNEGARRRLREGRGRRVDGNAFVKSRTASVAALEDEPLLDPLDTEVGPDGTKGICPTTPGTIDPTPPTDARVGVDGSTPGTRDGEFDTALGAIAAIDWPRASVEIIATASKDKWVFANGRPIGKLDKDLATANVQGQWDNGVMEKAFVDACRRGLNVAEAREFGLKTHRFRLSGNDAMRTAMRNANSNAMERARQEIAHDSNRTDQSLSTAFLGIMKGAWGDISNPMRDKLVSALASAGVAEPRGMVDAAIASTVEPTLKAVFAKAKELKAKPDVARNEVASYVVTASYQGRVSPQDALLDQLDKGNGKALATASVPSKPEPTAEETASDNSTAGLIRKRLGKISGTRFG